MCSFNHKLYDTIMSPIESHRLASMRKRLLMDVSGDLLEIGYGTGANLRYYDYEQIDSVELLDAALPNHIDLARVPKALPINAVRCDAHKLPYKAHSFDSVVFTLVFCSVTNPSQVLSEITRVLRPGGRIYFIEHVEPIKEPYKKVFNILTPAWKKIAKGCHLNRDTIAQIQQGGFQLVEYHRFYRTSFVTGIGEKI